MIPTYVCHTPSGSSTDQLLHFGQEVRHGYFGERMKGLEVPHDYPLHKITVPMSLHYSIVDTFTHPKDVGRLISQLNGTSDLHIQSINHTNFNHLDFVWGIQASDLIYPQILNFFKKHTRNWRIRFKYCTPNFKMIRAPFGFLIPQEWLWDDEWQCITKQQINDIPHLRLGINRFFFLCEYYLKTCHLSG